MISGVKPFWARAAGPMEWMQYLHLKLHTVETDKNTVKGVGRGTASLSLILSNPYAGFISDPMLYSFGIGISRQKLIDTPVKI
jgi:hypothetical protein